MGKIYHSLIELIGQTPLLEPERFNARYVKEGARLLLKLERTNPGGSSKDRVALALIEAAERDGTLRPGGTIVEPTSGNTGIGLAWTARLKGYNVVLTMPETMSVERMSLLRALGARLELTPAAEGMAGAVRRADELCATTPGAVIVGQFDNPANADAPPAPRSGPTPTVTSTCSWPVSVRAEPYAVRHAVCVNLHPRSRLWPSNRPVPPCSPEARPVRISCKASVPVSFPEISTAA